MCVNILRATPAYLIAAENLHAVGVVPHIEGACVKRDKMHARIYVLFKLGYLGYIYLYLIT